MSKPVEVWCLRNRGGNVGGVALSEVLPSSSFTVERRLLVKEGATWQDGVEACIKWLKGTPTTEEGTMILSHAFIIENLRALSPQSPKDEATESLRKIREELLENMGNNVISSETINRIDTYLKGKT